MSNSIGSGGGGGGGFDIGGMIGGLIGGIGGGKGEAAQGDAGSGVGQSGQMGQLQGLLDPLGLFPAISGGIGKLLKGADASQISVEGKRINELAAFDRGQAGATQAPGIGAEPPVEYQPPTDPAKGGAGYGEKKIQQLDPAAETFVDAQQKKSDAVKQDSQAMTGKEQRQSSSAAATAASSQVSQTQTSEQTRQASSPATVQRVETPDETRAREAKEELKAMKTISANFNEFDQNTFKDGLFDQRNIEFVASNGSTAEVRAAAQYLLDHPELMLDLQVSTNRGHGLLSLDAITARMHSLLGITNIGGGTKGSGGAESGSAAGGKDGAGGNDGAKGKDGAAGKDAVGGAGGADDPDDTQPLVGAGAKTLEDCLEDIGGSMAEKEKKLIKLLKSDGATPGQIAAAQQELARINQSYQQMYELIGNLRRTFHEMSMHSINHIR